MATQNYVSLSNLTSFFNNLKNLFATKTELSEKSNKSHTHAISEVTSLQSALNGKANSSHGTHVSYSSTAPVMDGTASVGSASTVARSDHKHPTDSSRAAKTDLDSLSEVVSGKANTNHTHSISNITNLQTSLDEKAATSHTHKVANISDLTATVTELNYMDGVTSGVQAQIDGKASTGHTHSYAGSSSVGGAATSANKLNTNAGSATHPIYFKDGVPVETSYTLGKSVPSDAKFTDTNTHYSSKNVVGATNATSNTATALTNGNVYINSVENGAVTSSHKISGSGATTVTTDTAGNIIISSTDNNTTYSAADSALGLVKSGGDVTISSGVITVNDDSHNHTIANVDNLQSSLDGKSNTGHTHNYAGSSSVGGAATSANKVNSSLTVQLNSGTTEGTNKFTFDGSTAKSFNITPSSIGASASSHMHDDRYYTETEVDSKLSGKANSSHGNHVPTTQTANNATFLRNDNTWQKVTPTNIGAAATSHTHTIANITDLTATATELNYMDGVTSNVQTQLDGKSGTSHTHKYAGSSSVGGSATSAVKLDTSTAGDSNTPVYFSGGKPVACTSLDLNTSGSSASCTGNSATATKLQTARTISLGTGATGTATSFDGTGNITIPVTDVKESYLSWGGKNLVGSVSPIGASLSSEHSANRIAYLNPAAIAVEYSNDAGSTWTDSGLGDSAKINFVTTSNGISVGSNSTVTTNHRMRVTLTAQNGTTGYVYTRPRKMLINVSTAGHGLTVTIEAKTGASGANWQTLGTYELNGWSGWNDIPISISTFGGGANQTGNYWYIRLTFANTSVNSSYTTTKSSIIGLRLFGDTCWTRTSNMGETGHLYSYDASQNATFPANVTATTFVGALSGNATTATTATKLGSSTVGSATQPIYLNNGTATACTYTLGKSVPSNAVFTDTNTKVTNTLATTTKAYVTGTTSASTNTGTQVFDTGVYLDTTAGQLTATTFNGTTFSGSGVATVAEVKSYLGI